MDESSALPNINMKDDPSVKLTIRLIMQGKVSLNRYHNSTSDLCQSSHNRRMQNLQKKKCYKRSDKVVGSRVYGKVMSIKKHFEDVHNFQSLNFFQYQTLLFYHCELTLIKIKQQCASVKVLQSESVFTLLEIYNHKSIDCVVIHFQIYIFRVGIQSISFFYI